MNVQLDDLKALCDLQKAELVKIERKLEESVCSLQKSQLDSKELESEIAKLTLENKSLLSDLDKERVTMSTRLSASKDLQIEIEAQLEQSRGQTEAALLEMARCKEELALSCADLRQNADSTETMEAEIALLKEKVLQFNVLEDTVCTLKRQLAEAERGNESLKKGFELEADAVANRHKAQLAVVKDAQHASSALSSMLESRIKELETVIDQQKASHLIQLDQISSKNAHLEEELSILYSAQKIHLEEVARGHETEIKKLKSSLSLEKLPEIDAISSGQLLWIKYQQEVLDHHLQMSYINDIEANFVQPVLYQGLFSATNNNAVSMSDVTVHVDLTDIDEVSLHDMKQLDRYKEEGDD